MHGLKVILVTRRIKLKDISIKLDIGYSALASYTNGFQSPPENVIEAICEELNIRKRDLYDIPDGLNPGTRK